MMGDEQAMERLNEHDEKLKQHEERIAAVEQQQREYNLQQTSLKNDVKGVQLSQQDLKNTIEKVGQEISQQNSKLFDHVLGINKTQIEQEGQLRIVETQQNGALKISQLSTKAQIFVGIFGTGGLIGLLLGAYTIYEKAIGG